MLMQHDHFKRRSVRAENDADEQNLVFELKPEPGSLANWAHLYHKNSSAVVNDNLN